MCTYNVGGSKLDLVFIGVLSRIQVLQQILFTLIKSSCKLLKCHVTHVIVWFHKVITTTADLRHGFHNLPWGDDYSY
jgi:hypothetical protein